MSSEDSTSEFEQESGHAVWKYLQEVNRFSRGEPVFGLPEVTPRALKVGLLARSRLLARQSLENIARRCHLSDLYLVTAACLDENASFRELAWEVVSKILSTLGMEQLACVDSSMRSYYLEVPGEFGDLTPPPAVLGSLSFNRSGHLREQAVQRLAGVWTGEELPFLLLRGRDWVPEVASIAAEALRARAGKVEYGKLFAHNLGLIAVLSRSGQPRVRELAALSERHSLVGEGRAVLADYLRGKDKELRCYAADICEKYDQALLVEVGLNSSDPRLRLKAFMALLSLDPCLEASASGPGSGPDSGSGSGLDADFRKTGQISYRAFLNDPDPAIRVEALRKLQAEESEEQVRESAIAALLDRSGRVRLLARYILKDIDPFALYLDRLASTRVTDSVLPTLLAALLECGKALPQSVLSEKIEPLVLSGLAPVRAGAYAILLDETANPGPQVPGSVDKVNLFKDCLLDGSRHCHKVAKRLLSGKGRRQPGFVLADKDLWPVFCRAPQSPAAACAIAAIARSRRWQSLPYLVEARWLALKRGRNAVVLATIDNALAAFHTEYAPTEEERRSCLAAMENFGSALTEPMRNRLLAGLG
ncbi:MAG TPA: hypothetical protein PKH78_09795 [Candidatus Obscuribacter sp.]|nr:hypothetical protein [Candidatus Obscuribacter sp.]